MDNDARIAKTEAVMDTNRQDIDRLYQAVAELRKLLLERTDSLQGEIVAQREYMDRRFEEQRDYVDRRFDEQRGYVDRRFDELRNHIDDALKEQRARSDIGFAEIRREVSTNQRWMISLTLINTTMILGLGGRLFGLY